MRDAQEHNVPRVAWLGVEPTPYNMPLLDCLKRDERLELRLFFCARQIDQPWAVGKYDRLIDPASRKWRIRLCGHFLNPAILQALWTEPWDAVVICGYGQPTMQGAILACIARRIPFILQGDTHALRPRNALKRAMKRLFVFPVLSRCRAAMGIGGLAKKYWESTGIPRERVFVVPLTPHLDHFRDANVQWAPHRESIRRELGVSDNRIAGIFVGRLVALKQVDLLLEALALMTPAEQPHLIVVGEGPERSRLESMAAARGLPVTFAGFLQNEDIARLYSAADFFVLPSSKEAWGIVVAEAAAAGLPLLLSDQVGAAYDLLRDGSNGYLLPAHRVTAWRDALERCVKSPSTLKEMGGKSRDLVSHWNTAEAVKQFFGALKVAMEGVADADRL